MIVRRFRFDTHVSLLIDWTVERKSYLSPLDEIPLYGYVAYIKDMPIAMAFLRRIEGGFAQLDGLITNPNALSSQRHKAIDALTTKIIDKCKRLGMKALYATSRDTGIILRSKNHGFRVLSDAVLALDLKDLSSIN